MAKAIKITIKGSDDAGTDAPTVEDFLGQVHDFLDVLQGVEKALTEDGNNEIIWRITNAQMNSPLLVEITPFAKNPAIYVDERAENVERATMEGIRAVGVGELHLRYFTEDVLKKTRAIHARMKNGLADTVIGFDATISSEPIVIDRNAARRADSARQTELKQEPPPYREIGSVEGFVTKAELDGFGRAILRFKARIDGAEIKAVASGHAFQQLESMRLSDVWQGVRVRVYGLISYRRLGVIDDIAATGIEVMDQAPLPGPDDIVDENFTGGLRSEDYLAELRYA